jgi:hypothetical protein
MTIIDMMSADVKQNGLLLPLLEPQQAMKLTGLRAPGPHRRLKNNPLPLHGESYAVGAATPQLWICMIGMTFYFSHYYRSMV